MSTKQEQLRSLTRTSELLYDLLSAKEYPKNKTEMRERASDCLRHFPILDEMNCYRLLNHNDTIRADDEFLEDDCVTWTVIGIQHRWNVGCYWHTALNPMRRILGDNVEVHTPLPASASDETAVKP